MISRIFLNSSLYRKPELIRCFSSVRIEQKQIKSVSTDPTQIKSPPTDPNQVKSQSADPTKIKSQLGRTESVSTDPKQIEFFNNLSDKWWDTEGPFKALHSMNSIRVPFITKVINPDTLTDGYIHYKPLNGKRILDVGCGGGILSEALARLGADVVGIDMSINAIEAAESRRLKQSPVLRNKMKFINQSIEDTANIHTGEYDCVVASEVIEHVADIDLFIKSCSECVKDNGTYVVTTISRTSASYLVAIIMAEYVTGIIPKGTHDWSMFVTPETLKDVCKKRGLSPMCVEGCFFLPPPINKFISSPTNCIQYMAAFTKF
eukprot:GHVR01187687.1.p1 GENE.GHVR01187687.1~~GHVR01187687.1.p1  ORF type:complete len:319 (+),score=57.29 GHVR01187687.1:10-966(+)